MYVGCSFQRAMIFACIESHSLHHHQSEYRRGEAGNNKLFLLLAHALVSHSSQRSEGSRVKW